MAAYKHSIARSQMSSQLAMRSLALMVLLLSVATAVASEVSVPLRLDYQFLRNLLLEQVYTDRNDTALVLDDQLHCSTLVLSNPQIGHEAGRIRILTAIEARLGQGIGGQCWYIPKWQGFIEVFQETVIVPGQPTIEFSVVESKLLDREGGKPLVTGVLWNWVKQHVHPRLATLKVDLTVPLQEIQTFIPLMLTPSSGDAAQRMLESVKFTRLELTDAGIVLTVQFFVPAIAGQAAALTAEPVLTEEEALRWEAAWQRWDAFLTFVIKQVAQDTQQGELRQALLEVLLAGRYDLTEALTSWQSGTADPVRALFLKNWERLSPILQQMEASLPGTAAIRYLSFITAADALKAMDQMGEKVGYEISADGLRRLARMLAPAFEEDPLLYSLEVDRELRRLFGFGAPLPLSEQAPDVDNGSWFFFAPAWAADEPVRALIRKLNRWVPEAGEIESYLPLVEEVLDYAVHTTIRSKVLRDEYHDFFRNMSLATAWQESCWRQFVEKSGRVEPLISRAGAVGIMQVNPNVWRGFYEIPALRNDISYNASAGNEILHHYLTDYVLAKSESKGKNKDFEQLARLTYVAYNGGPGYFERYRKKVASKSVQQIATVFWQKYQAMKSSGPSAVASCYVQS